MDVEILHMYKLGFVAYKLKYYHHHDVHSCCFTPSILQVIYIYIYIYIYEIHL